MHDVSFAWPGLRLPHTALLLTLAAVLSACSVPVHRPAQAPRPHGRPATPPSEAAPPANPTPPSPGDSAQDTPLPSSSAPGDAPRGAAPELEVGLASWYGGRFHGRRTASGERYDKHALTAAHRSLPFHSRVRVRHLGNGRELVVRITDRGPFVKGRIIDLSQAGAKALGVSGVARVSIERLDLAPPAALTISDASGPGLTDPTGAR